MSQLPNVSTKPAKRPKVIDLLLDLDLGLPADAAKGLARRMNLEPLPVNHYLMHQGEPGDSFHLMVSGLVEVVSHGLEGREVVYRTLERGDPIGELTVVDRSLRTASIRVIEDSEILSIDRTGLLAVAHRHPEIGLWLAQLCAEKARALALWSDGRSFEPAASRLAGLLLELSEETDDPDRRELGTTQQALGDRLGISREWINKALKGWENDGLIELGRGRVTILDTSTLVRLTSA